MSVTCNMLREYCIPERSRAICLQRAAQKFAFLSGDPLRKSQGVYAAKETDGLERRTGKKDVAGKQQNFKTFFYLVILKLLAEYCVTQNHINIHLPHCILLMPWNTAFWSALWFRAVARVAEGLWER